jgi:hypothetical protein
MDFDDELADLWLDLASDLVALGRTMSEAERELCRSDFDLGPIAGANSGHRSSSSALHPLRAG